MARRLTQQQALAKIARIANDHESQQEAARRLGLSQSMLSMTLNGARDITPKVARAFGLRRVVMYEPIEG